VQGVSRRSPNLPSAALTDHGSSIMRTLLRMSGAGEIRLLRDLGV
jgi:hypothetical protein